MLSLSHMAKRVSIPIIIAALLCNPIFAAQKACPEILAASIQATADQSWWGFRNRTKNRLEKLRPAIERELDAACPNLAACSVDAQQEAVTRAIEQVLHSPNDRGPGLRAYAMFLGAIALNSAITMTIVHSFDKVTAGITVGLVSGITGVIVAGLGAPIYERLSSVFTGFSWRLQKHGAGARNPRESSYERSAVGSKEDLTPLGQSGRGINRMALAAAMTIFTSCAQLTQLNREAGLRQSASQISRLLVDLRKSYTELDLTHEEFTGYAHDIFTKEHLRDGHHAFIDEVMANVAERHADGDMVSYRRVIEYWLRPNVTLSSDTRLSQTEPPSPRAEAPSLE